MTTPNQFLLYDSAVLSWAQGQFGSLLIDPTHFLIGTPDRGFAEYLTPTTTTPRAGRPPLPRVAISLGDPERDPNRFNSNIIRLLGWTDATKTQIRRALYPIPVKIPYTLDIWTEKYREMNLFTQQIIKWFRAGYNQLLVDIDSISPIPCYGQLLILMYAGGSVKNTGELEPRKGERYNRRTFGFDMQAWIWDFDFKSTYAVKEVGFNLFRDKAMTLLLEGVRTPQREVLVTSADGHTTNFGPLTPKRHPVVNGTYLVDATISGAPVRGQDDTAGHIVDVVGSKVTGTIDYASGAVNLVYTAPPDVGTVISCAFYTSATY